MNTRPVLDFFLPLSYPSPSPPTPPYSHPTLVFLVFTIHRKKSMNKCTTAVHHFLSSIQLIYTILLILHLLKHTLILRYTNLFGLTKRRTASFHAFIRSKGGTRRMEKMRDEFVEDGIVSVLSRACYETRSEQRRAFNTSLTHDLNRAEIEAIRASGEVHSKGVVPTDRFSHGKQPRLRLPQKFRKTDFFLLFPSFSL